MPRVFTPGHRPDQPLYPTDLVYTTVAKVEAYLQLPEAKPTELIGNTSTATVGGVTYIKIPISGKDYRRWGFATDDVITLYDETLIYFQLMEGVRASVHSVRDWYSLHNLYSTAFLCHVGLHMPMP